MAIKSVKRTGKSLRTMQRILDSAAEEFAAYGMSGSRVERIADNADAKKPRIYDYFGGKEGLFQAVMKRELGNTCTAVPFDASHLPEYAGRLFDYASEHPILMRLIMWNAMEPGRSPMQENGGFERHVEAIREMQDKGEISRANPAEFILTLIVSLASAWSAANPIGASVLGKLSEKKDALRDSIINTVRMVCEGKK
ncbi:MAG: TetR family transcriptional regulator [Mailhella sp.]|nr:TetR family transcriptional regulator [Mailhella sp.]